MFKTYGDLNNKKLGSWLSITELLTIGFMKQRFNIKNFLLFAGVLTIFLINKNLFAQSADGNTNSASDNFLHGKGNKVYGNSSVVIGKQNFGGWSYAINELPADLDPLTTSQLGSIKLTRNTLLDYFDKKNILE